MDKVQENSFTDYNTPSSETFRLHFKSYYNIITDIKL
jgi:hypothetical protein